MCNMTIEEAQMQLDVAQAKMPQRIEFTVQEDFVKSLPQILSNIAEIKAWATARTALDRNAVLVTDDDFKQAKDRCAQYNKVVAAIDSKRKDVKKAYIQPLEVFEKAINETKAILTEAKDNLWSQVTEAEEAIRKEKLDKLTAYWEQALDSSITCYRKFTDIADPKWLNKGVKYATAFEALDKAYQGIVNDIQAIKSLNSEFEIALLEYYKDGHNLGETIAYNMRLQNQKTASETAKAETQANTQNEAKQSGQAEQTSQTEENVKIYEITFKVVGTKTQLHDLRVFMNKNGIKFEMAE